MDPEAYLRGLEPIGWRFGLERIQRLLTLLGMPQRRFASIHVVGTNGKSSVTMMAAALLDAHGRRTGAYLSPHRRRWSERVRIGGAEIGAAEFAAAVERVAATVPAVERGLEPEEAVTQFEAATAAALVALAAQDVEVAVIEAGLGGRLDATNVLPSAVTALTTVGIEHTEYLGETEAEIAAEKLAVLRDHSALVVGALPPAVMEQARRAAAARHAAFVDASRPAPGTEALMRAPYLARDLAVAIAAAERLAGPLDRDEIEELATGLDLPGRMETMPGPPPTVLDAAHNPAAAAALAEALQGVATGRPVVACVAVLAGKDAAGILSALAPRLAAIVCTEIPPERLAGAGRPGSGSVAAGELAALGAAAGVPEVEAITDPAEAVARARALAVERGGLALVTGSHYLLDYGS